MTAEPALELVDTGLAEISPTSDRYKFTVDQLNRVLENGADPAAATPLLCKPLM